MLLLATKRNHAAKYSPLLEEKLQEQSEEQLEKYEKEHEKKTTSNKWTLPWRRKKLNYHDMNIHQNVDFLDTKHGLEMRRLKTESSSVCFHVRLSPASASMTSSLCILPMFHVGQYLLLTHVKSGETRDFNIHEFQVMGISNLHCFHGVLKGNWK